MPKTPLFSTYRQGENRVTSSILAVLERIDFGLVERLLGAASGDSTLSIMLFVNQSRGPSSIPDGEITASCRYLFEVKTTLGAVRAPQLVNHLRALNGKHRDERLFVISPDAEEPAALTTVHDPRLTWFSFSMLAQAIDALLSDQRELIAEQTRFLLRELQALFEQDGLLRHNDTVVVAARFAWPEYLERHAYICQPNRSFQKGLRRVAFYTEGAIQRFVPEILAIEDNVTLDRETEIQLSSSADPARRLIGEIVRQQLDTQSPRVGLPHQIFALTAPDDERTLKLEAPIRNSGSTPWTQGQRYTRSDLIARNPRDTAALEGTDS